MDISSLSVPKAGRSRFSKALPTPPSGIADLPSTTPRGLPDAPPAPLPPKKNNILITNPSVTSLQSKSLDSPLPVLPIMAEAPRQRAKAGPIARKPVARPLTPPTPPSIIEATVTSRAMKRQSSISSLLSAYSRSSSDWAQRSSHESDFTKDSEPSYSPEREALSGLPPMPPKKSMETTSDIISDKTSEVTSYTIIDAFPPPPPLKDPARPQTPSTVHRIERAEDRVQEPEGDSVSLSPVSLRGSGSSRVGREIWRRRASSKSDGSIVIADLKLPSSNGSTASTSHEPGGRTEAPSFPPLVPAKTENQPTLPALPALLALPAKTNHQPPLPLPPKVAQQPVAILPPRTTSLSTAFPGRNIRPIKKTEPSDEDDEMKKLLKFAKLKELVRRGGGSSDGDDDDNEGQKQGQKKGEQQELQVTQNPSDMKGTAEADKPQPPAKDDLMQKQKNAPVNTPATAAGEASSSQASPLVNPTASPKESGNASGTMIARRPVGAMPVSSQNQSGAQPELEKRNTSASNPQSLLPQPSSGIIQPRTPAGSLPHPRHRQQQPPRITPTSLGPRYGPTSPTGGMGTVASTSAHPQPYLNRPAGPPVSMAGYHRSPGTVGMGSPNYRPQGSRPPSSEARENPSQQFTGLPRLSPTTANSPPFLAQPSTANDGRENAMQASGWDAQALEDRAATEPISPAAVAALARFPRGQNTATAECTTDGVWQPRPLNGGHYNCFTRHDRLVNSRNTHYPLACQACGVADAGLRRTCTYCHLRICLSCADVLVSNRRDLRATIAILREQGKIHDWSEYPKRRLD